MSLSATAAVEGLLERARALGASDLHLDPDERGLVVRARRDGALEPLETLPAALAAQVIGRLKSLFDPGCRLNPGKVLPLGKGCMEIRDRGGKW